MSLWRIAWGYLWSRKLTTVLTVLSVALAVGLISAVLTLREETRKRFEEEGQAFDLVAGAKGSPLQLVLSAAYFMDKPTGNIRLSDYEQLKQQPDVMAAYPIGLGDTYKGFRIVGTTPELLDHHYIAPNGEERRPYHFASGRAFEKPMEVVLGSVVARQTGLQIGNTLIGTHGFVENPGGDSAHSHAAHPYTVVGILEPSGTPMDRAMFCDLRSVWDVHAHHEGEHEDGHEGEHEEEEPEEHAAPADEQVTAVLLQLKSPALRFTFKEYINHEYNAMAAIPAEEVRKLYDELLGTAKTVLLAVGYLVVVISALSIMIGLYLSILQRRRDLAIMRALGAGSSEIIGAVLIEAFWVTLLGIGSGWVLGRGTTYVLGQYLSERFGLVIHAFGWSPEEMVAFMTIALVGIGAGILPAWQAYRTDVAKGLSDS